MAKIAHVFPGQGAFLAAALSRITEQSRGISDLLGRVEAVALRRFGRSLVAAMSDPACDAAHLMRVDPALLQLGIFTISLAADALLRAQRVTPDVLVGHSFGEIAALTCAGVFSIEQGAEIVCDRVECLAEAAPSDGCMAAISAGADRVRGLLAAWHSAGLPQPAKSALAVAVENHDSQTIISGSAAELEAFVALCRAQKISAQKLHSPYGFHHPALAEVTAAFAARLARYPCQAPQRPVYSPIMGRYYQADDNLAHCLARHLVMPVAFGAAIRRLARDGVEIFIECGGLDGLTRIVGRILGPRDAHVFATFTPATVDDGGCTAILTFINKDLAMNAPVSPALPEFETFWRERSPFILALIKSEFSGFLMQQLHAQWLQTPVTPAAPPAAPAAVVAPPAQIPATAAPLRQGTRDKLFAELVGVYAEAMEYPAEVFTETVELEAELGIDSVKQTEIMGRLSETYALPTLPATVRISEFKTMGQVVDLVFANQGKAAIAA